MLSKTKKRVLVQVCCATCTGSILESLRATGIDCSVYFYNPNIDTQFEYKKRKKDVFNYAHKMAVPFIEGLYDPENWAKAIKGLEQEPERGERCKACFAMRLKAAANYAHKHGYELLTTSMGISRWKSFDDVKASGLLAVEEYQNIEFLTHNWRKNRGSARMYQIAKQEKFYMQDYCGCKYSKNPKIVKANNQDL